MTILTPASLPKVRSTEFDWTITQTFIRLDGSNVTVTGWGMSRDAALKRFKAELWEEENTRPYDPLEDLGNILWGVAGLIDLLIKAMKRS